MIARRYGLLFLLTIAAFGTAFGEEGPESFIKEGNDLFLKMDYEKAISSYGKGIESYPNEPVLYYNRGNAFQKKGDLDKAISDYLLAVKQTPKEILLKNIYFNLGNAYYKRAEKLRDPAADKVEPLKNALTEYESASDAYRKSLEIEREFALKTHTDFEKIGTYAQKNLALAREAWTETWEQIKLLERKNLKLEDGVENLLTAQMDLLPRLETVYLNSANEDMLNFNLKTLAQYHVDAKEDIAQLRELSDKEIERANAELENHKASAPSSPKPQPNPQGPNPQQGAGQGTPAQAPDEAVPKLEAALKNATEIKKAVDHAAGLSEWVIDGLNTKKPLDAWKNSYLMVSLLKNLSDYLKKKDAVLSNYQLTLKQIAEADILLKGLKNDSDQLAETSSGYDPPGLRIKKLSNEKLNASAKSFLFINEQLEKIGEKLAETAESPETPGADGAGGPAPKSADDPFLKFFQSFDKKAAISALTRSKEMNLAVLEEIKSITERILKDDFSDDAKVTALMTDTLTSLKFYETTPRSLIEIMVETYRKANSLIPIADQTSDKKNPHGPASKEGSPWDLMDVLLFKYAMLLSDDFQTSLKDLGMEPEKLENNLKELSEAYKNFENQKKADPTAPLDPAAVETLRDQVLTGLRLIAPEAAAALFYESLNSRLEICLGMLPGTQANSASILESAAPIKGYLKTLLAILDDYFKGLKIRAEKTDEAESRDRQLKSIEHRKMAVPYLEKGSSEYEKMSASYLEQKMLTGDFLLKDLKASVEKSLMVFSGQPDDAIKALKSAISYQTLLKEHSQVAIDITTQERSASNLSGYLSDNQKDIQMLSGIAAMKIREMGEKEAAAQQNPILPGQAAGPQCQQGIDPAKREEALTLVQDAMIEEEKIRAFLEAMEYHNTFEKHGVVIEKLEKALSILENKESKENNPDKNKEDEKNKENQNQNEQQQNQQNQDGQGQGGEKKQAKPLELTPDQARELLNELNQDDSGKKSVEAKTGNILNVPRPW